MAPPQRRGTADAAAAADRAALYRRHAPLVRAVVARCRALPAAARDDGIQEAWLAIFAATTPADDDLAARVARTAWHAADHLARRLAAHPAEPLDDERADARPGREPDPAAALLDRERDARVHAALEATRRRVPEVAYRVFHAHMFDRRRLPEVAAELGLSVAQARRHNRRVVAMFRRLAAPLAPPPRPRPGEPARHKKS